MRITYVYKNVSHLSSDKEPEYHFILQVFFRYGCPSQLLTAGPLKIHGNVWKTEAEDESSDRILNSVSRGLTKDIRLKWCQSTCHGSKAVQHEGCQSRSSDTVSLRNGVMEDTIKYVIFTYLVLLFHFCAYQKVLCFSLQRCIK